MKTITPDTIFDIQLIGQAIQVRCFRQRLVKCGIKNSDLYYLRKQFQTYFDPFQIDWIMQRSDHNTGTDRFDYFVRDHDRLCKFFAAMHDPMPDTIYFTQRIDNSIIGVRQTI